MAEPHLLRLSDFQRPSSQLDEFSTGCGLFDLFAGLEHPLPKLRHRKRLLLAFKRNADKLHQHQVCFE